MSTFPFGSRERTPRGSPRVAAAAGAAGAPAGADALELLDALGGIVWEAEAETRRVTFVSRQAERLLGYPVQRWLDEPGFWAAHVHPGDRERVVECCRRATGELRDHQLEYRLIAAGGTVVWVRDLVTVVAEGGVAVRLRGVIVDVTGYKRMERSLLESEARFRDFAETAADWLWETDAELRYRYLSGRFEEVMGVAPGQLLGSSAAQLFTAATDDGAGAGKRLPEVERHEPFEGAEFAWTRPDGITRYLRSSGKPVFEAGGRFAGYRGACRDVTDSYLLAQQMAHEASHDALTGLVNRAEFESRLQHLIDQARAEQSEHALCYLDLDQFKVINDTCGHVAGDELLRQLGELLKTRVRRRDTVARLGGDEFGLLMEHCDLPQARRVANTVRRAVDEFRFFWEGQSFSVRVSVGLVPITERSDGVTTALSAADAACYAAKDQGRNRVHVYREHDAELARRQGEMQWVTRLQQALEEERFELSYQPIVPLGDAGGDGGSEHIELLLRMRDEGGALISPAAFLGPAERYNLAARIDRWVVRHALGWLVGRPGRLDRVGLCCINLSGHSLADEELLRYVVHSLDEMGVPGAKLCFEITETAAISNLANATHFIGALRGRGCRFALDDFGSGLSSFAYLKSLPVDFLKIDGQFVKDILNDPIDFAMVRSINDVGHILGKKTIAEFVENEVILEKLKEIGVDYAQGYGVSPPRPLAVLA